MTDSSRGISKTQGPWIQVLVVAIFALSIFVAFLVWRLGFHSGATQSQDLLLASPNAETEVVLVRAQLENTRQAQNTLLSVVLAAFGAGFTILVLVNVGGLIAAQRSFDRDERAMRIILSDHVNELVSAQDGRFDEQIKGLELSLEMIIEAFNHRQSELQGRASDLESRVGNLTTQFSSLRGHVTELKFDTLRLQVREAIALGDKMVALRDMMKLAEESLQYESFDVSRGALGWMQRVLETMERADWDDNTHHVDESDFEDMIKIIDAVVEVSPNNSYIARIANNARDRVEEGRLMWRTTVDAPD